MFGSLLDPLFLSPCTLNYYTGRHCFISLSNYSCLPLTVNFSLLDFIDQS